MLTYIVDLIALNLLESEQLERFNGFRIFGYFGFESRHSLRCARAKLGIS